MNTIEENDNKNGEVFSFWPHLFMVTIVTLHFISKSVYTYLKQPLHFLAYVLSCFILRPSTDNTGMPICSKTFYTHTHTGNIKIYYYIPRFQHLYLLNRIPAKLLLNRSAASRRMLPLL